MKTELCPAPASAPKLRNAKGEGNAKNVTMVTAVPGVLVTTWFLERGGEGLPSARLRSCKAQHFMCPPCNGTLGEIFAFHCLYFLLSGR